MNKKLRQWSKTALATVRQALSEQEGTPRGNASPSYPIPKVSRAMSSERRSSTLHVGDRTIVGKLLMLGREQEEEHDGDNTKEVSDKAHVPAIEEECDGSRDQGHRPGSAGTWEEKEGFVIAGDSRDLQEDEHRDPHLAMDDDELVGEGANEGTADAGGDIIQHLLDVSERLQKNLRAQQQVTK